MAGVSSSFSSWLLTLAVLALVLHASSVAAFGAGNIASISKIEGHNWRHGDIEDMLKTVACLTGHKWTSMMIRRVYFGNWLRDYSQALDVGTLKGIQAGTIRILIWVLSFMSFGYATAEFEVTEERLGVYRPEEHIDNPKDYADNQDARKFDPRLRPPVQQIELDIDPATGMKNYIANERLPIATSSGYVSHSLARSIHFGRVYTSGGAGTSGKDADLCEALRCLGQALHCLEDFGAHTNYTELALRELGYHNVFPHTGTATRVNLRGKQVFPLVTGTFGAVDFFHSVLGEATDHFAQTEVDQMDIALGEASKPSGKKSADLSAMSGMLNQVGAGGFVKEAEYLQAQSEAQARSTADSQSSAPPGLAGGPTSGIPGMSTSFDPLKTAAQIYPILEFRDKVVRAISAAIEKVPGLEALVEKVTETLTLFVLSLLAPFIRPIINAISGQLKAGSSSVVDASGKHQYEPWTDPHCSDPTHSLLSKDHFSNILNEPAGKVAAGILQYVAPRVIYAWEHPDIPVQQVLQDVIQVFHHPAIRDDRSEIQRNMYETVKRWAHSRPNRGADLDQLLSSESVRQGKNHIGGDDEHAHGDFGMGNFMGSGSHSKVKGSPWEKFSKSRDAGGLSRDDVSGDMVGIPGAYPVSSTIFDDNRPPAGSDSGYGPAEYEPGPSERVQYQQAMYDTQSPYPPAEYAQDSSYGALPPAPAWNQSSQQDPHFPDYPLQQSSYQTQSGYEPYPIQNPYPPQHQGYPSQYGADPDAIPPQDHWESGTAGLILSKKYIR